MSKTLTLAAFIFTAPLLADQHPIGVADPWQEDYYLNNPCCQGCQGCYNSGSGYYSGSNGTPEYSYTAPSADSSSTPSE